jgi:hypothetical protein
MKFNTDKLFNRMFYIQKYYCCFDDMYIWRFWILGFYFSNRKPLKKY